MHASPHESESSPQPQDGGPFAEVCVSVCVLSMQCWSRGGGLSGEAWELEAPVDSCHVKVSKCKADVCGGPGRGARIYLGPESACDLRFIAFFQIHPFYNDGGPFLLEDLRGGSLQKIVQRQVWGSSGRRWTKAFDQPPGLLFISLSFFFFFKHVCGQEG